MFEVNDMYEVNDLVVVNEDDSRHKEVSSSLFPVEEELFTVFFHPTLGQLFLVRPFDKEDRRSKYQAPAKVHPSSGYELIPVESRRVQKNRSRLVNYNVHNRLRVAGTLTQSDWPNGVLIPLQDFIKGLQRFHRASFPWTAVAEIGTRGQPHWHLCLPDFFDQETLEQQWDPQSHTDFQFLETTIDLIRWSRYMGKNFGLHLSERLTHRRFHAAKGFHPIPIKMEGVTRAEAFRFVEEQALLAGSEIKEWEGSNAWCPKAYFWEVPAFEE